MQSYYQSITISSGGTGGAISLAEAYSARRRSRRIRVDQTVRFRTVDSPVSIVGVVRNLSLGGVYIEAPLVPRTGQMLAVGFLVRRQDQQILLHSMGEVVWSRGGPGHRGFGVRFVEPARAMLATISALIRDRCAGSGL